MENEGRCHMHAGMLREHLCVHEVETKPLDLSAGIYHACCFSLCSAKRGWAGMTCHSVRASRSPSSTDARMSQVHDGYVRER